MRTPTHTACVGSSPGGHSYVNIAHWVMLAVVLVAVSHLPVVVMVLRLVVALMLALLLAVTGVVAICGWHCYWQ